MPQQQRDVLPALAQRRNADGEDVDAEVEVAAELPVGDELGEVAARGRDQPGRRPAASGCCPRVRTPAPAARAGASAAAPAEVADLVEEERAFMRELEAARAPRDRAGEGASFVAEELAFQQPGGDGRAVHLDQAPRRAPAELVQGLRQQLLARARFPEQQDIRRGGRDDGDVPDHLLHGGALADRKARPSDAAMAPAEASGRKGMSGGGCIRDDTYCSLQRNDTVRLVKVEPSPGLPSEGRAPG